MTNFNFLCALFILILNFCSESRLPTSGSLSSSFVYIYKKINSIFCQKCHSFVRSFLLFVPEPVDFLCKNHDCFHLETIYQIPITLSFFYELTDKDLEAGDHISNFVAFANNCHTLVNKFIQQSLLL